MNNLPNTERKCRNVDSFLAFLLFVCLLFTAPYVRAQETRSITLNVQNETVENVFNQLGVQTGLKFFYDQEIVNAAPRLNRNRVCINLIYSYYILFFSRFDTVKFPQNYDTQK